MKKTWGRSGGNTTRIPRVEKNKLREKRGRELGGRWGELGRLSRRWGTIIDKTALVLLMEEKEIVSQKQKPGKDPRAVKKYLLTNISSAWKSVNERGEASAQISQIDGSRSEKIHGQQGWIKKDVRPASRT